MPDIDALLGRLTPAELDQIRETGRNGHLSRELIEALDRAAGGPEAARGYYVADGSVSDTGAPRHVLRDDVRDRVFGPADQDLV
jgi:hypothetical protein